MVPRKTRVSENLGPILKSPEAFALGLEVSFLGDFASLSLGFFFKSLSWILKPGSCSLTKSQIYNSVPLFLHWWGTKKYTTLPLTIKIPLTVRFQTQQLGFTPQKPTFLNSNSIRNAQTFNTWAPGLGDWATTPHANELK